MSQCTHLVANKVTRTMKFLCGVSVCKHIVTVQWVEESHKNKWILGKLCSVQFTKLQIAALGEFSSCDAAFSQTHAQSELQVQHRFVYHRSVCKIRLGELAKEKSFGFFFELQKKCFLLYSVFSVQFSMSVIFHVFHITKDLPLYNEGLHIKGTNCLQKDMRDRPCLIQL